MSAAEVEVIELRTWSEVRDAFRSKHLRQAGYTEGAVVIGGALLDLHGEEHRQRRRLENRLFRRETFAHWEHHVLGATIQATLGPFVEAGRGDLAQIGYRSAMNLTATIAGIDHDPADGEGTEYLYGIVKKFSEGATIMHSTRDKAEVVTEVRDAMERFRSEVYEASLARRLGLINQVAAGDLEEDALPRDVLTTLLRNHDKLELPDDVLFREICFYLQAGAHSTSNAFTHTVDDILTWGQSNPGDLDRARTDVGFAQRCMHESLRLSPASPVAYRTPLVDVELGSGTHLPAGSRVILELTAANTDPDVFGPAGADFDPHREIPDGVPRWGMSFGGGMHACIGAELDGGLEIDPDRPSDQQLFGTVAVMANAFLSAGGQRDPANPPQLDPSSTRKHFSTYPVVFLPN